MKTKGRQIEGGKKAYTITHEGASYDCQPDKSKWLLSLGDRQLGSFKTIKEAKEYITTPNDESCESIDKSPDDGLDDRVDMTKESLWDCPHPCALLIEALDDVNFAYSDEAITTLDNWGWCLSNGKPDVEQARKHLARWRKKSG